MCATLAAAWSSEARAEPRFALRTGQACAVCHVDPVAGGLATDAGLGFAHDDLATWSPGARWDAVIAPYTRVGALVDIRGSLTPPVHTEIGSARFEAPGSEVFELASARVRLALDPVPDRVVLALDQEIGVDGARTHQALVMIRGLPGRTTLRGGQLRLPYGLGLRDDDAFVRRETGAVGHGPRVGLELGLDREALTAAVAIASPLDGEALRGRRVSASAELRGRGLAAGASLAWDDTADPRFPLRTWVGGVHAGARLGPLIGLVELDLLEGRTSAERFGQAMLYAELDAELRPGLWLQGVYEAFDPVRAVAENERDRFTASVTWYPVPHLALEAACRIQRDIPQRPQGNADQLGLRVRGTL